MKLREIQSNNFIKEFNSVLEIKGVVPGIRRKLVKIAKILEEENKIFQNIQKEILEDCVERDEKGEMVKIGDNQVKLQPSKQKEFHERQNSLLETEIEDSLALLTYEEIDTLGLSAKQELVLSCLIKGE